MENSRQPSNHISDLDSIPASARGGVLTIGNFDGVHLGHQRILAAARALADADASAVTVLTLEPPPEAILRPQQPPCRITPLQQKVSLLIEAGADLVVTARTDQALLSMSPEDFIQRIIVGRFQPRHVVEGPGFAFGRGRSGGLQTLVTAGASCGFTCHTVDPAMVDLPEGPTRVSSTLIRRLVQAGDIDQANRCLGREFTLYERVVEGAGQGRLLSFPTVNLTPAAQVVPADGVYAGRATANGMKFSAAVSVGNRPTLGPSGRVVEAFLIGATGDFYSRHLALSFVRRLRDQRRFESADELKAQIAKDVELVRQICG